MTAFSSKASACVPNTHRRDDPASRTIGAGQPDPDGPDGTETAAGQNGPVDITQIDTWSDILTARLSTDRESVTLLRLGENATLHLRDAGLVVRLYRSPDAHAQARREIAVARTLARAGVSTVRPAHAAPRKAAGRVFTLWHHLDHVPGIPDPEALGAYLSQMHAALADLPVDRPPMNGARLDPAARMRARMHDSAFARLDPDVQREIAGHVARAESMWARFESVVSPQVIHGDVHWRNFLTDRQTGRLHAADFDSSKCGPLEWDLAPFVVRMRRFGGDRHALEAFWEAYDAPRKLQDSTHRVAQVLEISTVTRLALTAAAVPAHHREMTLRLATLKTDPAGQTPLHTDQVWTLPA